MFWPSRLKAKNTSELQPAWEVLYKVEDLVGEANGATEKLLEVLEGRRRRDGNQPECAQ